MSSAPNRNRRVSLRWRLLAAYGAAFTVCLAALYALLDVRMQRTVLQQVDTFLQAEGARLLDLAQRRKPRIMQNELKRLVEHHGAGRLYAAITHPDGTVLAATGLPPAVSNLLLAAAAPAGPGPHLATHPLPEDRLRCVRIETPGGPAVQLAQSLADAEAPLRRNRQLLLAGLLVSLLIGTALTYLVTAGALHRVAALNTAAETIARGDISHRVPIPPQRDELHDLAVTFNAMLARIEALMAEVRGVTDDIAHELRTPLTRIRGTVEPLLTRATSPEETRDAAALVVEECDRLARTIAVMLQIARLESSKSPPPAAPLDLVPLIRDVADAYAPLLEDKHQALTLDLPATPLNVRGDAAALQRALGNLLDNAIKYTPDGGSVTLRAAAADGEARLDVNDTGIGLAANELPHIFDRFYRAPGGAAAAGTGLGLCLVRAIILAHHGTIRAESTPGQGTRFHITLPHT